MAEPIHITQSQLVAIAVSQGARKEYVRHVVSTILAGVRHSKVQTDPLVTIASLKRNRSEWFQDE